MRQTLLSLLASSLLLVVTGCAGSPSDAGGGSGNGSGPTFHKDIEPILQKSCQSCHSPGNIAPFSLLTYEDAKAASSLMKEQTSKRTMPPWGAFETSECQPERPW